MVLNNPQTMVPRQDTVAEEAGQDSLQLESQKDQKRLGKEENPENHSYHYIKGFPLYMITIG
jgi:hypothetical protein